MCNHQDSVDSTIDRVSSFKLLGVYIDCR